MTTTATITNIHRNIMGTTSFDAQFAGMRKPQEFIVYPMHAGRAADVIKIQSDTRIGLVCLDSGYVTMSKPRQGGAYGVHLAGAKLIDTLNAETLLMLKAHILASASGKAGTNGVMTTDNSGALEVFGSAL